MWCGKRKRAGGQQDLCFSYKFTWTDPATGKEVQIMRKTTRTSAAEALEDGRAHLHLLQTKMFDLARQLRRRRAPVHLSLAEILRAYLTAPPAPRRASPDTRAKNLAALSGLWKRVHGFPIDLSQPETTNPKPGTVSASTIDAGQISDTLVWQWKEKIRELAAPHDEERQQQLFRSANSILRQAQSIFSKDMLEHYTFVSRLELPDTVRKFASAPEFRGVQKTEYNPPPDAIIRATLDGLEALRERDRNLYVACWLALGYGLRASEIAQAKKSWFIQISGEPWLGGDVLAKNKKFPRVRAQLGAWLKIQPLLEALPDDAHALTGTATERADDTFRRVSAWMQSLGWQTQHHLHELRAWAIAQVAEKSPGGLYDAQAFARHRSHGTTERSYGQHMKRRLAEVRLDLPSPTPFEPKILHAGQ